MKNSLEQKEKMLDQSIIGSNFFCFMWENSIRLGEILIFITFVN